MGRRNARWRILENHTFPGIDLEPSGCHQEYVWLWFAVLYFVSCNKRSEIAAKVLGESASNRRNHLAAGEVTAMELETGIQ
jgi:hypothetical protein